MTLQEAKSIARHLGLTLRKVRSGDYRVNFRDGNQMTAYYTDSLEDAVNTAVEMARKRGGVSCTNVMTAAYALVEATNKRSANSNKPNTSSTEHKKASTMKFVPPDTRRRAHLHEMNFHSLWFLYPIEQGSTDPHSYNQKSHYQLLASQSLASSGGRRENEIAHRGIPQWISNCRFRYWPP
jgi:hypothetical protein